MHSLAASRPGMDVVITETPSLHRLFSTAPLPGFAWGLILLAPPTIVAIEETRKLLLRQSVSWLSG